MKYDILAIGELLIDMTASVVNNKKMYTPNPGGAPANFLTMAQILGISTCFVGKVGDDYFGNFLKNTLEDQKVSIEGLKMDSRYPTTLAFVHLDKGDSSFSFYRNKTADVMLEKHDINYDLISDTKAIYFGSLALIEEPLAGAANKFIKKAKKEDKMIFFDVNYRPTLWEKADLARDVILKEISYADVLKLSEQELYLLTEEDSLDSALLSIKKMKVPLTLITRGSKSTIIIYKDKAIEVKTYNTEVVDTTGAGDAFFGAVSYGLINANKSINNFSELELIEIVNFANYVASMSVRKHGGIPSFPTSSDLIDYKKGKTVDK